jgi:hypothetical protein
LQRLSPAALYYVSWQGLGSAFADDLGAITEAYVGEQLNLVSADAVLRDVEYGTGQRAADYVAVFSGLTFVIEVKSARVSPPGRLDHKGYLDDLIKDVGKAITPVKRTCDLIRDGHPKFPGVPAQQEIRGIIVTAEPHYMLNGAAYRAVIPDPVYPTNILSLGELESDVAAAHAGNPVGLFAALTTPVSNGTIDVMAAISQPERSLGVDQANNPLLDVAYANLWRGLDERALEVQSPTDG